MKIRYILTFAACASLLGSPLTKALAADASPAPATSPVKAPEAKPHPSVDPEQAKFNAARIKANADPAVKAAMDAAHAAQLDANKKMLEKVREIDPSLSAMVDAQLEKMKPREPKAAKPAMSPKAKPSPKAADKKLSKKSPSPKPADATNPASSPAA
jgi:hypothetical protein